MSIINPPNKKRTHTETIELSHYITFGSVVVDIKDCQRVWMENRSHMGGPFCYVMLESTNANRSSSTVFDNVSRRLGRRVLTAFASWLNDTCDATQLNTELATIAVEADAEYDAWLAKEEARTLAVAVAKIEAEARALAAAENE